MLIGEVAKASGLSRDTIRFYEREGLISAGLRTAGTRAYGDYAPEVVQRLGFIKQMQGLGFTLREIKHVLHEWGDDANETPNAEIIEIIEPKLRQTEEKIRQLEEVRAYLMDKIKRLQR